MLCGSGEGLDVIAEKKEQIDLGLFCLKIHLASFLHDTNDRYQSTLLYITTSFQRPYQGNAQYTYNNWSPPAQSNETSNGYFLERSQSARVTLAKAIELCPEEVSSCEILHNYIATDKGHFSYEKC